MSPIVGAVSVAVATTLVVRSLGVPPCWSSRASVKAVVTLAPGVTWWAVGTNTSFCRSDVSVVASVPVTRL